MDSEALALEVFTWRIEISFQFWRERVDAFIGPRMRLMG